MWTMHTQAKADICLTPLKGAVFVTLPVISKAINEPEYRAKKRIPC